MFQCMQFILNWHMPKDFQTDTSWDFLLTRGWPSPWPPHTSTGGTHLACRAILVRQAIRTTRAVVAPVSPAKEISYVAQGVRHHITLPRHRVWPLPGASWENEEEIWSPTLARGSPESRAVSIRATSLKSRICPLL